MTVKELDNYKS